MSEVSRESLARLKFRCIIIGAGPAGLAPLIAAARSQVLPDMLKGSESKNRGGVLLVDTCAVERFGECVHRGTLFPLRLRCGGGGGGGFAELGVLLFGDRTGAQVGRSRGRRWFYRPRSARFAPSLAPVHELRALCAAAPFRPCPPDAQPESLGARLACVLQ
jgi:hypothetical protein